MSGQMAEIKKILTEHNSKLVQPGSLTWMFQAICNDNHRH